MSIKLDSFIRVLLAGLLLLGAMPVAAHAQSGCPPEALDCETDTVPPSVIITPTGGDIHSAAPITFTVRWCDQLGMQINYASRTLTWRGANVRSQFSAIAWPESNIPVNCNQRQAERGTLTPAPGNNTLVGTMMDDAGNVGSSSVAYYYDIVDVFGKRGVRRRGAGGETKERFLVRNVGATSFSYVFRGSCTGTSLCTPATTTATLAPNESLYVDLRFTPTTASVNTRITVSLIAKYATDTTVTDAATASVDVIPPTYSVEVTPRVQSIPAVTNTATSAIFTLRNFGNASTQYALTATCGAGVTGCTALATSPLILPGDSAAISVAYNPGTATAGTLSLRAVSGVSRDSGTYTIRAQAAGKPHVVLDSLEVGSAIERSECLNLSLGDAAYECGDLRLVHALPTVRTLNKPRTPVLIYNSLHADPMPIVGAWVTVPAAAPAPATVKARILVGGVAKDSAQWSGSEWTPGQTRRIAVPFVSAVNGTNLYAYSLEVQFLTAGPMVADTAQGQLAIVDRRSSAYGKGWWIAGLEQLVPLATGDSLMLWVGGDGSTRRYVKRNGALIWDGDRLDRPDTLTKSGSVYTRWVSHRVQVQFDAVSHLHTATVNRLGQTTQFQYVPAGGPPRLSAIVEPTASGTISYSFQYATDTSLASVGVPGVTGSRSVIITGSAHRIASIRDLDSTLVSFEYPNGSTGRVSGRVDRRLTRRVFAYDAAGKLCSSTLEMQTGNAAQDITTSFRAAESRGVAGSSPASVLPAGLYTLLDGPRSDVGDTTLIWPAKFGGVRVVKDAVGAETRLYREVAGFPALANRVRTARGYQTIASYDTKGLLVSSTDSGTYVTTGGTTSYATTTYAWDPKWEFVSRIVSPDTRDTTRMTYDAATGNRIAQRNGAGDSVSISYDALGRVRKVVTVGSTSDVAQKGDSLDYDATLGNLKTSYTPLRFYTKHVQDLFGRDTVVSAPLASDTTLRLVTRIAYDWAGLVASTRQGAPALPYTYTINGTPYSTTTPAESTWVVNQYDEEGNLLHVKRGSVPNMNQLDTLRSDFGYDRANRKTSSSNDGVSTVYYQFDKAGNTISESGSGREQIFSFDALGHLTRREFVDRVDPCFINNNFPTPNFPRYSAVSSINGGCSYTVHGDTARFVYDSVGGMTEARDRDAWVFRDYAENGALAGDSLYIRTLAPLDSGGSFSQHKYALRFTYDIAGRRVTNSFNGASYTYDPAGRLATVNDGAAHIFGFNYNRDGQLDSLAYPDGVYEKYTYDADGRMTARLGKRGTTTFRNDVLTLDARGKVTQASTLSEEAGNAYAGLGALVRSTRRSLPTGSTDIDERLVVDALGYRYSRADGYTPADSTLSKYEHATGRLVATHPAAGITQYGTLRNDTLLYNGGGDRTSEHYTGGTTSAWLRGSTVSFYGNDGMAITVDARRCTNTDGSSCIASGNGTQFNDPRYSGSFDEYRYDALGRRIWARSRKDDICSASEDDCTSTLVRFVWDGNEIIAEYRTGGGNLGTASNFESDVGSGTTPTTPSQLGKVVYVNGPSLDVPLEVSKNGLRVIPYHNWRGLADQGTYFKTTVCHDFLSGTSQGCGDVDWPAARYDIFETRKLGKRPAPQSWWGSLLMQSEDQTGQMYRRNRYYDAENGVFTQQDPVGIAGGLNVYGYAAGDPITYSDPFGLTPRTVSERPDLLCTTPIGCGISSIWKGIKNFAAGSICSQTLDCHIPRGVDGSSGSYKSGRVIGAFVYGFTHPYEGVGPPEVPQASDVAKWAERQGWTKSQTANGPIKYTDENGVVRVTLKQGSPRTPGSENPHMELRNAANERVDVYGNPISRRSPENHSAVIWDLK